MADGAISSLLQTLECRFFTGTGHTLHPNNKMPDSFYTFNLRMLKFQTGIGKFYAKLLDEGQQSVIITPEDIAFLQEVHEWIQREYREFEDEIRNSSPNHGEGSAELCTSDMLCPFRRFREWFECLQVLTNHLNFFVVRLNELMNGTEPQSIKMIKIEEKTGNVKVVVPEIRSEEGIVVGIEEEVKKIKHLVIGDTSSRLEIISIVGMGGIGKSTLARVIYHDNKVSQHFDVRTWITVSQIYDARAILLSLLNAGKEEHQQLSDEELRVKVFQSLKYRRYLIIMDDVWNTHVCDDIKKVLPNDDNASRVVLTTRQTFIADYAGSEIYNVPHMSKDTSWNLLEKKVFGGDNCPLELAEIGTDIAQKCHGLPLTIVVIAGLLQVNRTRAWWENIANDVKSAIYENDEHHVFDILSLSYDHLPGWLQPCLLYFVRFSEDEKISVSNLIKLWAAEGFLESRGCKNLEVTGYECLEDLIRRNLVSTIRKRRNGLPNKCFVHDLVRDMCIKLSQGRFNLRNIHFLSIGGALYFADQQPQPQRLGKGYEEIHTKRRKYEEVHEEGYEFLRALDVPLEAKDEFPYAVSQVCELVNLRYLSLHCFSLASYVFKIPTNIYMCINLETLVIYTDNNLGVDLPAEIWAIPKLRHLITIGEGYLDYVESESETSLPLESLETISNIRIQNGSVSILKRIPNIRKLGVRCIQIEHLVHLHHLEILHLGADPVDDYAWQQNCIFPNSLRKLKLDHVKLPWDDVGRILGSLPNLEVLKLKVGACQGRVWETTQGCFLKLKILEIEDSDLEIWSMESSNDLPVLQQLRLSYCQELKELPWCMVEMDTLQLIEVACSSKNVDEWAEAIMEQQEECEFRRLVTARDKQTLEGDLDRMFRVMELTRECEFKVILMGGKE